mgnify:CR=1 FL=1
MTNKIIALRGVSNVGKSTTIKKVYDLLTAKYKDATSEPPFLGVDIRVVLTINGIKIGIESQGDPSGRLEESLSLFVKVGCKVIICATRTRGQTVDAVDNLKQNYEIVWLQQEYKANASEQEANNLAMAKKIIMEAEKVISV